MELLCENLIPCAIVATTIDIEPYREPKPDTHPATNRLSATADIEVVGNDHRVRQGNPEQALGEIGGISGRSHGGGVQHRIAARRGYRDGGGMSQGVDLHGHKDSTHLPRKKGRGGIRRRHAVLP